MYTITMQHTCNEQVIESLGGQELQFQVLPHGTITAFGDDFTFDFIVGSDEKGRYVKAMLSSTARRINEEITEYMMEGDFKDSNVREVAVKHATTQATRKILNMKLKKSNERC